MLKEKHKFAYDEAYLHTEEQATELILSRPEQFYVYVLINPLNNLPFYVGKGQGNRCFSHWSLKEVSISSSYKNNFMRRLSKKVKNILYAFHAFTNDEKEAYLLESQLIEEYGLKRFNKLNLLYNWESSFRHNSYSKKLECILDEAKRVHKGVYDYSKVVYRGYSFEIEIICPIHGSFWQTPFRHRAGCGCQKCGCQAISDSKTFTKEEVLFKFKEAHGDLYDYSLFNYSHSREECIIICPKHGKFSQTPYGHWRGYGCRKCAKGMNADKKRKPLDVVIKQFQEIHGTLYDYSKVNYLNNKTRVEIICKKHGSFKCRPDKHLNGTGCIKCKPYRNSPRETLSLN